MSDEPRDLILKRRRAFAAVALASAGLTVGAEACSPPPQPCLDVAPVEPAPAPTTEPDAGVQPGSEPLAPTPESSVPPQACLDFAPAPGDGDESG